METEKITDIINEKTSLCEYHTLGAYDLKELIERCENYLIILWIKPYEGGETELFIDRDRFIECLETYDHNRYRIQMGIDQIFIG